MKIPPSQQKEIDRVNEMGFLPVGKSLLTLYNRPGIKTYKHFKEIHGITMVITAQAEAEMVDDVRKSAQKHGMKHFWIDLRGANQALMTNKTTIAYLRKRVMELYKILSTSEEKAILHCAAGIHRTGTMGYTLLRMDGRLGEKEAYQALGQMRPQTLKGVGDWRIKLAEDHLVAYFNKKGIVHVEEEVEQEMQPVLEDYGQEVIEKEEI